MHNKNGSAYVNLPLVTGIRNRIRLLFGSLPETSVSYKHCFDIGERDGNHLHYFSMSSIHGLAHSCGLRLTAVRGKFNNMKTWLPGLLANEVTFRLENET